MKLKNVLLIGLSVFCLNTVDAQLINQFKKEEGVCTYLQFPTQKERKSEMTIQVIEENMLGNIAEKVIKNDAIAGALTSSLLSDEKAEPIKLKLIPDVFFTDGDLLAEVSYSGEFKSKKTMWLPEETYNTMSPSEGQKIQALVSFNVYTMPNKELIYTLDKMWVNGMMKKSSSNTTTSGNVSMTSGSAIESATKSMVTNWSKRKLDMLYGMGIRNKTLTSYMIKKQEKVDKKAAEAIQEKLIACVNTLRKDRTGDAFNADLDECIAHYNKMIKKHKPGTKKQKEALVTDNNVWCMHYNLAVANLLKGNEKEATANIEKATKLRVRKTKEYTNKKGEKVGESSGMIPAGYFEISDLKTTIDSYFKGNQNMPKEFVAFLNSEEDMRFASSMIKELGANFMMSTFLGLETPANFVSTDIKEGAKSFTGSVNEDDAKVDYAVKKTWYAFIPFLQTKYILKGSNSNTGMNAACGYKGDFVTLGNQYSNSYSLYLGDDKHITLPSYALYKKSKNPSDKTFYTGKSHFQYDYNGDLIITCSINKDKGWWYTTYCVTKASEHIGLIESQIRVKHKDFKAIESVSINKTVIERSRDMKFFEAYMQKMISHVAIPTTELSNKTTSNKVDFSKKIVNNDNSGNMIEEKISHSVLKREFIY